MKRSGEKGNLEELTKAERPSQQGKSNKNGIDGEGFEDSEF